MSQRMAVATLGGGGVSIGSEVTVDPTGLVAQREREKWDFQELNDRFASYIERVQFLEADNKRLLSINDVLKVKFQKLEEMFKEMYEDELASARSFIDDIVKDKGELEILKGGLEDELADYKKRYEEEAREHALTKANIPKLESMVQSKDNEINLLNFQLSQQSGNDMAGAKDEVKEARVKYADLQKEIMVLRENNAAFEERIAKLDTELDEQAKSHRLAIDERDADIEELRAQLVAKFFEFKELMDSRLALDAEIATYRRLLQGEESRLKEYMTH